MKRPAARGPKRGPAAAPARESTGAPSPAAIAGSLAAAVAFLVGFARLWGYVLDDTYISLRYAQHLTQGHGLVYNPGERVEGYSNFLWTLLLALPHALHIPPVPFLKVVLALAALATAWATVRLGRASGLTSLDGKERWLAWAPGWLFLLTPLVIERTADGLETIPFTLLLVLAVTWSLEGRRSGPIPRLGLALAALAMMRPDGVMFAPLLLGFSALRGARLGQLAGNGLGFLVPFALYVFARHGYYGDWLPNTFYAKRGGMAVLELGLQTALAFLAENGGWAWLAAVPALVWRRSRATAWLMLSVVVTRAAFHVWSGGEWVGRYRFLLPALPFLYLLVVATVVALPARAIRPYAAAAAALLLLGSGWLSYPAREANALAYGRGLDVAHGALGRAVSSGTAPDALIAMDDAGLGPYLSRRRNLDMLGLNDRHIARLPGRFSFKVDVPYVLGRSPDLIVLVSTVAEPTRGEHLPVAAHAALAADSGFHARYEFLRVYTMRPDYHLGVFRRRDSRAVASDF
jgi:arabinofuranosyltransferase